MDRAILYEEYKEGVHCVQLRTQCTKEDVKRILATLKSPYRVRIITNDLTIIKLGFKMVSRQCIGGIYIKDG